MLREMIPLAEIVADWFVSTQFEYLLTGNDVVHCVLREGLHKSLRHVLGVMSDCLRPLSP